MRRTHHLVIVGTLASIALTLLPPASTRAEVSGSSSASSSADPPSAKSKKGSEYRRLLDELDAERKRVDELEREVKVLAAA